MQISTWTSSRSRCPGRQDTPTPCRPPCSPSLPTDRCAPLLPRCLAVKSTACGYIEVDISLSLHPYDDLGVCWLDGATPPFRAPVSLQDSCLFYCMPRKMPSASQCRLLYSGGWAKSGMPSPSQLYSLCKKPTAASNPDAIGQRRLLVTSS